MLVETEIQTAQCATTPSSTKKVDRRTWAFALAGIVALRLLTLIPSVVDDDEALFAVSGFSMRSPGDVYHAVVDNKPPGLPWIYWALNRCVGAAHLAQYVRFFQMLLLLGAAALLARISKRKDTAILFLLAIGATGPKIFATTCEGMMIPFIVLAYVLVWHSSRSVWRSALSGAALAYATLIKQTGVLFLLPLLFTAESVGSAATLAMAYLITISAASMTIGANEFWHWAYVYPSSVLSAVRHRLFAEWRDAMLNLAIFGVALLPLLLMAFRKTPQERAAPSDPAKVRARRLRCAWFLAAASSVIFSRALFLHYFLLLLPPLVLMAEARLSTPFEGLNWKRIWIWCFCALSSVAAAVPAIAVFWGNDLTYFHALDKRVRALSPPEGRIFVWGGNPIPLAIAARRSVSGFPDARFVSGPYSDESMSRQFIEAFQQKMPDLVIDLHERGDNQFDLPISSLKPLQSILENYYVSLSDPSLPWVTFFKRRDASAEGPPHPEIAMDRPFALEDPFWFASLALVRMQASWERGI